MANDSRIRLLETSTPEAAGFASEQIDLIRTRASEWVAAGRASSLVLFAARGGKIALHEAFGVQSWDDPRPLVPDSIFRCASVSKVVTACAAMILVERGQLSLNRPIKEYLPEMRGKYAERILTHNLLTHTSGIAELEIPPIFLEPPPTEVPCPPELHPSLHAQLEYLYQADCYKKPSEQNIYASTNFTLLGEIIRRVSGQQFDEFAYDHIFQPLQMTHTTFRAEHRLGNVNVSMRDPSMWPKTSVTLDFDEFSDTPAAAGSLKSNAHDLAILGQVFANGGTYAGNRILAPTTVAEMTRNQIPGTGTVGVTGSWVPEASWGLGWMVQGDARWPWSHGALQPPGTYYHQGASGCSLWIDPTNDIVGVYLSVTERDMADPDPNWEFDKYQNMLTAAVV